MTPGAAGVSELVDGLAAPSTIRIELPIRVRAGAADQHQVGRAPEGHVLAEDPVPDVVERKADQGEGGGGHHRDPAERRVPVAGDPDRARARLALGEDDREKAGGEDPVEAGEDQVVGRVGERPGVAAVVDVQGDVPVHPEQGDEQRAGGDQRRQRRPGGEAGVARGERGDSAQQVAAAAAVRPAQVDAGPRSRAGRRRWRGRPGRARRRRRGRNRRRSSRSPSVQGDALSDTLSFLVCYTE